MKYAVVTGGTKGIGKNLCLNLLNKGYFVITTYSSDNNAAKQANEIFSNVSENFTIVKANQTDENDLIKLVDTIKQYTDKIDCYIGNAGSTIRKDFTEITNKEWEDIFRLNVHSNFYLLRDLDSLIVDSASIVLVGSLMAEFPHASSLPYGVTKTALHSLAQNLVKEYAPRKIRVNAIAPGFVDTEWQKDKPQTIKDSINSKTALARFANVEEIVDAILFCIENTYINGSILDINGGYCYK